MIGNRVSPVLVCAAILFLPLQVWALEITLESSRSQVTVGEQFTIAAEVRHDGVGKIPDPTLSTPRGLREISSYRSQSFSYVNGKMTGSVTMQYVLIADSEGEFTIGPASATLEDETVQSDAIRVKVVPAGSSANLRQRLDQRASPVPGETDSQDLIVLAKVDNETPYVNEQIVYTFTFLRRVRILEGSRYVAPAMTGFWSEELDATEPTEVVVDGKRYIAERVRIALFPTGPGEYVIGEATLRATVEDRSSRRRRRDPFDLLGSPFGRRSGREVVLQTEPITVQVKPLPVSGKPVDFSGAVGDFRLKASADREEVKAGEPITLTVVMSGQGNVKVVPAPDLSILEDFKVYESESNEKSQSHGGAIVGTKTWEFVLVPTSGGVTEIPPVRITVFDPKQHRYVTKATRAIPIQVEATDLDDALARGDDPSVAKERVRLRQRDIRYVKARSGPLRGGGSSPWGEPGFLLVHMAPVLAMAGTTLFRRHRNRLRSDVRYARARGANKVANQRLRKSQELLAAKDLESFFGELSAALRGYVADKLHLAAANLDEADVRTGLEARKVDPLDVEKLFSLLDRCDSARFSPWGSDPARAGELLEEARSWIGRVD